jgi:hypothetical protein
LEAPLETSEIILTDLKAVLLEGHREFSLLNMYKGVPLVCQARLDRVEGPNAIFTVQPPESATLQTEETTLVLSNGLLEVLEAKVECLDLVSGKFGLSDFNYAGSKYANRRELRVEPAGSIPVQIASDGRMLSGDIADLSVRGMGLRLPTNELTSTFTLGKTIAITLHLPNNKVRLEGKIRSIMRTDQYLRLAVEFTGAVPEKASIIHYVMQRRSEIVAEIRELYEKAIRLS